MKKPGEELKPVERRMVIVKMSDIKAKCWVEDDQCEFCPKIKRLNRNWKDCHGPRCRIERILADGEIIVEINDTKELVVCRDTDILPIDRRDE
jgi:hypothetical protein